MKENKLYRIFRTLELKEIEELKEIIKGSTVSPIVKSLFKLLDRQYPDFDSSQEGKEYLFSKLYPDKAYNDLKLRRHFSDLTKVILDFLNFNTFCKNTWLREKSLIEIYENAKLYDKAQEKRQELHRIIDQNSMKNDKYWEKKMILYQMEYDSLSNKASVASDKVLQNLLNASNYYFAYVRIRQALVSKSLSFVFNYNPNISYLAEVRREHQKGFLQTDALFKLYIHALDLLELDREDIFLAFESLFFSKKDELYGEDQLLLFYLGLNYVVRQTNKGKTEYRKLALDWYKFALKEDILLNDNAMETATFSNIVVFGSQEEEEWTLDFISKYIKYLPSSVQQEELSYSKAIVGFYQRKFGDVIKYIGEYSFSQNYIFKTKNLLLCAYFEEYISDSSFYQLLIYNINSYESYLKRNTVWTDKAKKPNINFCRVLKKMTKLHAKGKKQKDIDKWLSEELKKTPVIAVKRWLSGKVKSD